MMQGLTCKIIEGRSLMFDDDDDDDELFCRMDDRRKCVEPYFQPESPS